MSFNGQKPQALNNGNEEEGKDKETNQSAQQLFSIGKNGDNTNTVFRLMIRRQGLDDELKIIEVRA